jgi:hypothetical protein
VENILLSANAIRSTKKSYEVNEGSVTQVISRGYLLKLDILPISEGIILKTSFDERSRRAGYIEVSERRM